MQNKYIKLDDVLALLPTDDIVGPKPTYLRKKIIELPTIVLSVDLGKELDLNELSCVYN